MRKPNPNFPASIGNQPTLSIMSVRRYTDSRRKKKLLHHFVVCYSPNLEGYFACRVKSMTGIPSPFQPLRLGSYDSIEQALKAITKWGDYVEEIV